AGYEVECGFVAHRLGDAERDGYEVDDERRPQAERDRDRQPVHDQLDHGAVTEEALSEVEHDIAPHHLDEALVGRLVEAIELLELSDELGIEAAGPAILARLAARLAPH